MDEKEFEIFRPFEALYRNSLLFCTESALSSVSAIMALMSEKLDVPPQAPLDRVQNIANQGAAISRYFWPSAPKYRKRGEALRKRYEVNESSPLKSRNLRNMVEHFDEYLDDYLNDLLSEGLGFSIIPNYFGPKPNERGPEKFFRAFFTNTGEFEIFGKIFQMQPIVDEIERIHYLIVGSENRQR